MGSFHPHGDQAIYEALVRLAQDFASRYPLIDGQGNFGNIDGDGAAAYRYTEARMTDVARLLLEGVDEEAVDWRDNYSGDAKEPIVLPSAIPNLLANGAQGIAVGMATSIPPHNVAELCDAALYLIAHPERRDRGAAQLRAGTGLPDRRHRRRRPGVDRRDLSHRTRRLPPARALDARGDGPRRLGRRRHRNSLRRAEVAADRAARDAADRAQGASARRRSRRIGRGRARRARAEEPRRRSGDDDGAALQAQRARDAHSGQPQRAGRRRDAARRQSRRSAAAMARPPPRGAQAPLRSSPGGDRTPARAAGGHDHRLPQPRRGHPHRPRGRRAEDGADGALRAHRNPGQLHPRHPPAFAAPPRGDGACARSRRTSTAEKGSIEALLASEKKQWQAVAFEIRDVQEEIRAGHQARQAAHHLRDRRRDRDRTRRGADRARAGDHPRFAEGLDSRAEGPRRRSRRRDLQGRRRADDLVLRRDDVEDPGAGDATARPSRSTPPSCRAAAAPASRSG